MPIYTYMHTQTHTDATAGKFEVATWSVLQTEPFFLVHVHGTGFSVTRIRLSINNAGAFLFGDHSSSFFVVSVMLCVERD